eukprot:2012994-Amphidinium_carterae.1
MALHGKHFSKLSRQERDVLQRRARAAASSKDQQRTNEIESTLEEIRVAEQQQEQKTVDGGTMR